MTKEIKTINPKSVPQVTLRTGDKMPIVGLGTFGSDRYSNKEIAEAVKTA
ncbi:MAG: aldo/keto reductase, partial [Bacteroidales bacterium]|nr:aldo/keto reductase [Bacteroidales bacterium]